MKNHRIHRFLLLTLSLLPFHLPAQTVVTENGKAVARIVCADNDSTTLRAAALLQDFAHRATGVTLQMGRKGKARSGDIVIGGSTARAGEDGFELHTADDGTLYVRSGGGRGAIYAVVSLLERHFGINYLARECYTINGSVPTADGMAQHPAASITLPKMETAETPAFRYRQTHSYGCEDPVYQDWFRLEEPHEAFIGNLWVHTFNRILPASRFGKTHPEYYSFLNGERRPGDHSQWCLSNPDVFEACCTQLDSIFRAHPGKSLVSVSQNDGNDTYCHCPECMKIYEEEGGAVSGAYIRFMNKLAERYPDKQFSTLAYLFTCQPPKLTKPLPNVNIMLCDIDCKREVPLTDNASGQWFVSALEGWSTITDNIFVWDYGINFDNIVSPFPNFHILQPNIQLFARNHTTMHFAQVNGIRGGDFSELRAYLLGKLMWNPDADTDALTRTFLSDYYGAADRWIYQYLKVMQGALLASGKELWIYDSPISHKDGMLRPQLIKVYDELFDRAEEAVADDAVRLQHVRLSRLPLQYSKLEIARTSPAAQPDIREQLELFEARTAEYGVTTLNERNNPPADYCRLYRERFMPQERKSLALGAKVYFMENESDRRAAEGIPGTTPTSPSGAPDARYLPIARTALTDGLYGGTTYVESWVGWCGRNADLVIDLGRDCDVTTISADFLHQLGAWILLPKRVEYQTATDVQDCGDLDRLPWQPFGHHDFAEDRDGQVKFVAAEVSRQDGSVRARYIRLHAESLGLCPDWHYGVGYPAWFFLDEINVY